MTSPAPAPAYRSPSVSEHTPREVAIRAASRWAGRYWIGAAAFERAIERVERLSDTAPFPAARDSLTGLSVVEAPLDPAAAASSVTAPPHHRVYYRLATGHASLDVYTRAGVDRVEGDATPLVRRAAISLVVGLVVAACTIIARSMYVGVHAWFASRPAAALLTAAFPAVGLVAALVVAETLLGTRARRRSILTVRTACLFVAVAPCAIAAWHSLPSRDHIRALWNSGNPTAATAEAEAYDALHPETQSEADRLILGAIPADAPVDALIEHLGRRWRSASSRAELVRRLGIAANRRADEIVAEGGPAFRLERLADSVAEWLPDQRRAWLGRSAVLEAQTRCLEPEPNALCLQREMDRARDGGIPEAEVAQLQAEFVTRARTWLLAQRDAARAETDPFSRSAALTRVASFANSIAENLHVDTGVDLAALRDEIRTATVPLATP